MAETQQRLASDTVHSGLRADILEGRLAPGDPVPSERALAERLEVNRHAVREALKRLQQAGLIRISQGGATRVLDWRDSGGLGVLLDLINAPAQPPRELLRSVLEMREAIGVDAAGKFAERASDDERSRAVELCEATAAGIDSGSDDALTGFVELWKVVVDGSGNLAYRLSLNSLNAALEAHPDLVASLALEDPAGLRELGTALEGSDESAARAAAARLLGPDVDALS